MKSICFVVSDPLTVRAFLIKHLTTLAKSYEVAVAFNPGRLGRSPISLSIPGVETIAIPIQRRISPAGDLLALAALMRLYRKRRFDMTHSVTPKAGLLNLVAGKLTHVPIRLHTFTGQVWATRTGLVRQLLKTSDMLMARLATNLLADSSSQRDFLVKEHVVRSGRITVLADGSISGVDTHRFKPDVQTRMRIRRDLDIPKDSCVFLFTGRLTPDKGVLTLAEAFACVARTHPRSFLLVVGPDEGGMEAKMKQLCGAQLNRVRFTGYTEKPQEYMAASDVFCLPSRREGFGTVVIEAAAAGVPAIASRIYGLTDAIEDGRTGLLHRPGDSSDLAAKMNLLAESTDAIQRLSEAARARVLTRFTRERVTSALEAYYRVLFRESSYQQPYPPLENRETNSRSDCF